MTLFALRPGKRRAWASWFWPGEPGAETIANPVRARQNRWLGGGRLASSALASAALAALVSMPMRGGVKSVDGPVSSARGAAASWIDIQKPFQLYALPSPEFGKAPTLYQARRQAAGDGRADILAFGTFDGGGYLRISIKRLADAGQEPGFFIDLARRAAEAGLAVSHPSLPAQIASSFGGLDYASATLERGGTQARCQLFRLSDTGPGLHVAGLACAAGGRELEPAALACLVDRLSLISSRDDAALRLFFAAAELRRDRRCAGSKDVVEDRPAAALASEAVPDPNPPRPAAVPKPHGKKSP